MLSSGDVRLGVRPGHPYHRRMVRPRWASRSPPLLRCALVFAHGPQEVELRVMCYDGLMILIKKVLAMALIIAATAMVTSQVVSGDAPTRQAVGGGPAVLEHRIVRGTGDASFELGRLKPGFWRLTMAMDGDSSKAKVTVQDTNGQSCSSTPPTVVGFLVSHAAGGACAGGQMTLVVSNAESVQDGPSITAQDGPSITLNPSSIAEAGEATVTVTGSGWSVLGGFLGTCSIPEDVNAANLDDSARAEHCALAGGNLDIAVFTANAFNISDGSFEREITVDVPAQGVFLVVGDAGQTERAIAWLSVGAATEAPLVGAATEAPLVGAAEGTSKRWVVLLERLATAKG